MSRIAGQDVPEIVDIYVTQDASAYCTLSRLGCAQTGTDPKSAIGRPSVMPHEIAHVFEDTVTPGAMPAAYEEGFAEMFSGYGGVLPRDSFLSLMQADSATDLNYSSARHLTRWLVSQYGIESLFTLYQRSARNDDTVQRLAEFERTLDTTWMDLQMEFWRTAALYDPGPRECAIVDGIVSAKEGLIMSIPLDCESDGTFGPFNLEEEPGGQIASERVIEVAESGRYWLEASRGRVRLLPCEVRNEAMDAAFWGALDAGLDATGVMTTFRRYQSVELRTGRYILTVLDGLASEEAPVVVAVQLDRPLSIEAP
ncbi:MAG TPA: hypothetical protein ENJ18_18020 [Nannocystis exedens]|nr:hypothetical protein [Nannocystis exedens]